MRTLIIGGGAAGLYLSSLVPESLIIEKAGRCGRKLSITGGGRCNFTHASTVPELLGHYNGNIPFIRKILYSHTPEDIMRHMEKLGIKAITEEDGRVFPSSMNAGDVVNALMPDESRLITGTGAVRAEKNGDVFHVYLSDGRMLETDVLVIASGCSAQNDIYDGSGVSILRSFGHTVTPFRPALAPLNLERKLGKAEGTSVRVRIKSGKKEADGDAVITRNGISGPVILNISRHVEPGSMITLSFADTDIRSLREKEPRKAVKNAVSLPERLVRALVGDAADMKLGNLSKADERMITENLTAFRTKAWPSAGAAMTEKGGAVLSEFKAGTLESKLVPGLYAAGDVLDVDADTGGYNLTWAFACAWCISESLML